MGGLPSSKWTSTTGPITATTSPFKVPAGLGAALALYLPEWTKTQVIQIAKWVCNRIHTFYLRLRVTSNCGMLN